MRIATHRPQPMISSSLHLTLRAIGAVLLCSASALAQTPAATPAPDVPTAAPLPAQIDLNLINLPTTMSIVRHRSYFRLTHRFAADLRRGSFSDLAADFFTIDKGAIIGLDTASVLPATFRRVSTDRCSAGRFRRLGGGTRSVRAARCRSRSR